MTYTTVEVLLTVDEAQLLHEAAIRLSTEPALLIVEAARAYTRLCGFRGHVVTDVRLPPFWAKPSGEPSELLPVRLTQLELEHVELGAHYVQFVCGKKIEPVSLPQFLAGSLVRMFSRWAGCRPELNGLSVAHLGDPRSFDFANEGP